MKRLLTAILLIALAANTCLSGDWSRFRGPNGSGIADESAVPTEWGDDTNLRWKVELPGPGASCPIIVGDRVFLTCYTGYGVDPDNPGNIEDLQRHLVCIDRAGGDIRWQGTIDVVLPEDRWGGPGIPQHGYATHTPVSDGERVYVFFGKSGVHAWDMEGNHLWDADVGHESGAQVWGSAASPILFGNLLIVNASDENEALYGINTENGSVEWKEEAAMLGNTWGTPMLVEGEDMTELVIGIPGEIWGLNPETGKLRWYTAAGGGGFGGGMMFCSSLVSDGKVVYGISGRGGGAIAVRTGGDGDVSESHVLWQEGASTRFTTPVLYQGHLYSINGETAVCIDAETGDTVSQKRLSGDDSAAQPRREGGRRGFGGGSGLRFNYASPVLAGDKLIYIDKTGLGYVISANPDMEVIAVNRFESDDSGFAATPAVSDGALYIRSNAALYCVAE